MLKVITKTNAGLLIVFSALTLSACGGGGSSDDRNTSTAVKFKPGAFNSAIANGAGGTDEIAITLLSPSGNYAIFTTSQTGTFGTLRFPSNKTFSDDNGVYVFLNEKWMSIDGSLEGRSISSEEFIATFTAHTAEPSVGLEIVSIRNNELSDIGVTSQELSDNYSLPNNSFAVTITADGTAGTVTGSTKDGCVINGSITIPNPTYNIFEGNFGFAGCPGIDVASSEQRNGNYEIVGYLKPLGDGVKRLVFSGTNGHVMTLFSGTNGTN